MSQDTIPSSEEPDSSSQETYIKSAYQQEINLKANNAVYVALAANLGIFMIKLTFGLIGKSSAMLSEAVHSFADSFNSLCLIIGLNRGNRPADTQHPFGYGLEANVWTLLACILMIISGAISFYWGFDRVIVEKNASELLGHFELISTALVISIFFEAWAVTNATNAVLCELNVNLKNSIIAYIYAFKNINNVKSPTTRFVWYEDTAALSGAIIALIAISIARFLVSPEYAYIPDGIASIIIGIILLSLAMYLFKNYLTTLGAAAKPQVEQVIKETALSINGISQIYDLKTMDMGASGLIVNMEIEVDPETQVKDVDDITERVEERLKSRIPSISHVNIEVQADETEENWGEKFEELIDEGISKGVINHREAKMLLNFYTFTDTTVYEVMVPRTEINCLETNDTIDDLISLVIETGHTRIPIYEENIDNIIGVIHSKDLFKIIQDGYDKEQMTLSNITREIPIVPENKPISKMLNEFINNKVQMALVADEHGGIAGLVTIEDLLEEIFGEIWDEYDVEVIERKRIDANTMLIFSKMDIEEINERYDLDIPTEEFQTIGGYIFGKLGRVPVPNDEIKVGDITFTIDSMDGHKIEYIRFYKPDGIIDKIEEKEQKQLEKEINHEES